MSDDDVWERDDREERLPQWARDRFAEYRMALRSLTATVETAERAAQLARERTKPADVAVTYDGPDGESYGLPGVHVVRVGDIEVELTGRGVTLDATRRLIIEPISQNSARVRSV